MIGHPEEVYPEKDEEKCNQRQDNMGNPPRNGLSHYLLPCLSLLEIIVSQAVYGSIFLSKTS